MESQLAYALTMGGPPPRPEFISTALTEWCEMKEIRLHWIQPGKPTAAAAAQNAYIERFNAGPPVRDFSPRSLERLFVASAIRFVT